MTVHRIETKDPCAAARKLIGEGAARDDQFEMLFKGKRVMTASVGWLADHRVEETATISPRFVKWKPFPAGRRQALTAKRPSEAE